VEGIATQLHPQINMWDVSAPYVRGWIRDELGPESALAERIRQDTQTLLRVPELVRRLEEQFPAKGGAPEQAPLPDVELLWERRAGRGRGKLGYVAAMLAGGALVWLGSIAGWLG